MRTLSKEELRRAINFIIEYDAEGVASNGTKGIVSLLKYGCPAYKDYTQRDIEMFLEDNDHLTLKKLIE